MAASAVPKAVVMAFARVPDRKAKPGRILRPEARASVVPKGVMVASAVQRAAMAAVVKAAVPVASA
jgi:hypothetical protein